MRSRLLLHTGLILAFIALPQMALASVAGQSAPGESNLDFLLAGNALAWAGFFGYAFYLSRRNKEIRRELDELRERLADHDEQPPCP